jgi:uncharacterized RDD family membrane protein YckC
MADRKGGDGPFLFDLPLSPDVEPSADEEPPAGRNEAEEREPGEPSLFDDAGEAAPRRPATRSSATHEPVFEPAPLLPDPRLDEVEAGREKDDDLDGGLPRRGETVPASLGNRLAACLLDGGILLSATAVAVVGGFVLGVRWQLDDLAPLALFVALFTFVYSVVPLAFWGRTPGMGLTRTTSRNADGGPLTFGQTALRWLGGLLTVALAGLPLLLALPGLGGRSLADRLSGSTTVMEPEE